MLHYVVLLKIFELKRFTILDSYVCAWSDAVEIIYKVHKLLILWIRLVWVKWYYRNTIIKMMAKTRNSIIDYHHWSQFAVLYYTSIFDMDSFGCFDAVISIKSIIKQLLLVFHFFYFWGWQLLFILRQILFLFEFSFQCV